MESELIYVKEYYLATCVIVLLKVYFMICMCIILVVNSFVNLKRCLGKEFGKYIHVLPKVLDIIEVIDTTYQDNF